MSTANNMGKNLLSKVFYIPKGENQYKVWNDEGMRNKEEDH